MNVSSFMFCYYLATPLLSYITRRQWLINEYGALVGWHWLGETEMRIEKTVQCHFVTTNLTRTGLTLNPGLQGEKPTINRLTNGNFLTPFLLIWCDMIWHDMTWHVMIWYDMIWYDMIWYDMIWYDMIWYDMIWYDMIWYDMIYLLTAIG